LHRGEERGRGVYWRREIAQGTLDRIITVKSLVLMHEKSKIIIKK
jgi:hypothetical protein